MCIFQTERFTPNLITLPNTRSIIKIFFVYSLEISNNDNSSISSGIANDGKSNKYQANLAIAVKNTVYN